MQNADNKKKTIALLQDTAMQKMGKCLSSEYVGIKAHYQWECQLGHQWPAIAESVLRGSWCPTCAGQRKITIEEMIGICETKGGKFLSSEYINQHTKYEVICGEGHIFYPHGMSLINGSWCKKCQSAELWLKNRAKVSLEDYKTAGLDVNCDFIGIQIPKKTTIKSQWQCQKEGHVFFDDLQQYQKSQTTLS
jgi:hypothetical protein